MPSSHATYFRRWFLSLPPVEYLVVQLREFLIRSLKSGPIPQHIAFVMDGNRRYARARKLETVEGHNLGFEALARILEVCYKSGVKVVTIYAFSIENFKRSRYEVDALMDMAKTKLVQMAQHGEIFDRYGAQLNVLGDRSLLRPDVLKSIERAVQMTAHNNKAVLNVCFPYTGREEITHAVRETVRDFSSTPQKKPAAKKLFSETRIQRNIQTQYLSSVDEHGHDDRPSDDSPQHNSDTDSLEHSELDFSTASLHAPSSRTSHSSSPVLKSQPTTPYPDPENITEESLSTNMYTYPAPPLDLLVRTSGVQRLSDFMLWQSHQHTEIRFLECLWPEFNLWRFMPVLLEWQYNQRARLLLARKDSVDEPVKTLKVQ
ncbi:hypothetical protein AMS68_004716 [Peltaster fructicola]|uniref:Alkyl transferase n=1 Tax=Peltaster fructicola TaxID=286661 RepID=A0A6H0XX52_9PEZI|nr:hypothetical protein AMS68_004716 [Peltaster fructicola]